MGKHLSESEVALVETMARAKKKPAAIVAKLSSVRAKARLPPVSQTAVYRVLGGAAYQRGRKERRGRARVLKQKDKRRLEAARKKLLKRANSETRVTYEAVMAAAKTKVSQKTVETFFRQDGVKWRPARTKPERTKDEQDRRLAQAETWARYPEEYWTEGVQGYLDNKSFAVPTTPAKAALLRKQNVAGHLRKASEGRNVECVKPKDKRMYIGVPSIEVAALVSPSTGTILMFEWIKKDIPGKKNWCGAYAKRMYEGPLKKALEEAYPELPYYVVIEDGDPNGYQTELGKAGKRKAKIRAKKLPPRTPNWQPLDYSIWKTIEGKALAPAKGKKAGKKKYTKKTYFQRLKRIARGLSKDYVKKTCGAMKKRIQATLAAIPAGQVEKGD